MPTDTTTTSLTAGVLAGLDFDDDPACELKAPEPTHPRRDEPHPPIRRGGPDVSKDRTGRGKGQRMTPSPRQQPEGRLNPFAMVRHGPITAPSVVAFGQGGPRTAYVLSPIILLHQPEELDGAEEGGRAPRRAVVPGEATPPAEGEYAELTRRLGGHPARMRAGAAGTVINPLDPQITAVTSRDGQFRLAEGDLS